MKQKQNGIKHNLDRAELITLKETEHILGVQSPCIVTNKKYKNFYFPVPGSKNKPVFDIKGFIAFEERKELLLARVGLFIEYLVHITGLTYEEIAKNAGMKTFQHIASHKFSYEIAVRIAKGNKQYINSFDEYYGWKPKLKETE